MSISTKTCTRCNQEKELINFKKNPQAKSGYSCFCLECFKINKKEVDLRHRNKNRERILKRRKELRLLNIDINKERGKNRRDRKELRDGYVKQALLWDSTILEAKDIPAEIVELHRLNLTLKRLKREKCLC